VTTDRNIYKYYQIIKEMVNWVEQLKEWMKDKNISQKELSEKTGIKSASFYDYTHGKVKMSDEKRLRLYDFTKLEVFSNSVGRADYKESNNTKTQIGRKIEEDNKDELKNLVSDLESRVSYLKTFVEKGNKKEKTTEFQGKIKEISELFYSLIEKMDYLKHSSPQERELITKAIDSRDAGYLVSFLNAVYMPDKFNLWISTSNYVPRKHKGEK